MRNRKNTTKQERLILVNQFIASGQSQINWSKDKALQYLLFVNG